jgi:hypothetical protein
VQGALARTLLIPDLERLAADAVQNRQEAGLERIPEHDDARFCLISKVICRNTASLAVSMVRNVRRPSNRWSPSHQAQPCHRGKSRIAHNVVVA